MSCWILFPGLAISIAFGITGAIFLYYTAVAVLNRLDEAYGEYQIRQTVKRNRTNG